MNVNAYSRPYRTDEVRRIKAKNRRDALRAERLCINGKFHPRPPDGTRCIHCVDTHRRTA